ncbi:MBL fold metallo-hydrolase [Flavobacteriaceae bacterium AU392]|nr:MBL fold metallo-hydrolase [Flavobacteriaceae bacterium]RKM81638.1 MBL fold metallo-hydrolase [Flavobacteriaceae bacterium AU392]
MKNSFYAILLFSFIFNVSQAQGRFDNIQIETIKLTDNVYMLIGAGGNIGVSVGDDGVFVIDDQFAPLTDKIVAAIKKLSDKPIRFLANTHWHGDHSGGNENFTKLGATIFAHDNVRKRIKETPNRQTGAFRPKEALPVITFNDKLNLTMNGEQVAVFHVDNAHTDGDALLYFTDSNVLHTGDTYFNTNGYPFIDLNSGGSANGLIEAAKRGLLVINNETKIIPGHGGESNKKEYKAFLEMLQYLHTNITAEIAKGKTEDEVAANEAVTKKYDDLGYGSGFINSERIRRTFYRSLKK